MIDGKPLFYNCWFENNITRAEYLIGLAKLNKGFLSELYVWPLQTLDSQTWLQAYRNVSTYALFFKTPSQFFRSYKSLHLFETHCAFLPLFNPNLDFLQAVKVTKSRNHLSHDRASKGYGSIPGLTSRPSLHACLHRLILGDPGATGRDDGIFLGESLR